MHIIQPTYLILVFISHSYGSSSSHIEATKGFLEGGIGDEFRFHLVNWSKFVNHCWFRYQKFSLVQ